MTTDYSVDSVCFKRSDFNLYVFLLAIIIIYLLIIFVKSKDCKKASKIDIKDYIKLQEYIKSQQPIGSQNIQQPIQQQDIPNVNKSSDELGRGLALNRFYNPLVAPERIYPDGRIYNQSRYDDYQQIGIIYNSTQRLPLFGRPKYKGRTNKYEYYIIDETRNRLKIPYKTKNDNELYDGDNINVDILNDNFTVKLYEYDGLRYDPDVF